MVTRFTANALGTSPLLSTIIIINHSAGIYSHHHSRPDLRSHLQYYLPRSIPAYLATIDKYNRKVQQFTNRPSESANYTRDTLSHKPFSSIMSNEDDATISYPSIALVLGLAYLIYRYFASSTSTSPATGTRTARTGQRYTEAQLDTVSAMFPQLSRRDIAWDLQKNRGNVNATVERLLAGGRIETVSHICFQTSTLCIGMIYTISRKVYLFGRHGSISCVKLYSILTIYFFQAPPSFQLASQTPPPPTSTSSLTSLLSGRKNEPDLITRYKLQDRINSSDKGKAPERQGDASAKNGAAGSGNAWGATKNERQEALRRRRDEMILEARRKMLEKDALGGRSTVT